jgi:hypothetical protein
MFTIPNLTTIYGHKGSTAEEYAKKYNREFRVIGENPIVTTTTPTTTTTKKPTTTSTTTTKPVSTTTKETTKANSTTTTKTSVTSSTTTTTKTPAATTTEKPTTTTTTAPEILKPTIYGDSNCDGKISIADAAAIFQCLVNPDKYSLSEQGSINADVDGNSGITASDALEILKYDAKMIEHLPEKN